MNAIPQRKPWFREPWPWILASGPLLVVIASFISAWIAIRSSDGLVSEDYYRDGLAAKETISRNERAVALGLKAELQMDRNAIRVVLAARDTGYVLPAALRVTLSHPARAGLDQTLVLVREGDRYVARGLLPASGHWLILIEDESSTWRMMGSTVLPLGSRVTIGEPEATAPHP